MELKPVVITRGRLLQHLNLRGNERNYKRVDHGAEQPFHAIDASGAPMNRFSPRILSNFDSFSARKTV